LGVAAAEVSEAPAAASKPVASVAIPALSIKDLRVTGSIFRSSI
jgi:hypothetical protein